jgi:hypothetical protein
MLRGYATLASRQHARRCSFVALPGAQSGGEAEAHGL